MSETVVDATVATYAPTSHLRPCSAEFVEYGADRDNGEPRVDFAECCVRPCIKPPGVKVTLRLRHPQGGARATRRRTKHDTAPPSVDG
jgi:hypothetical protein